MKPTLTGGISAQSIRPEDLSCRKRTQNADGTGTLIFTRLTTVQRSADYNQPIDTVTVGFENIAEVHKVDALIERTFGGL